MARTWQDVETLSAAAAERVHATTDTDTAAAVIASLLALKAQLYDRADAAQRVLRREDGGRALAYALVEEIRRAALAIKVP